MRNATLRKLVIIVSSVAALGGGLGIDTAYAQGGGGFDRGGGGIAHMGVGFGGGHMGEFAGGRIGGEFGGGHLGGVGRAHMGAVPRSARST
jgi:hypothetical protein